MPADIPDRLYSLRILADHDGYRWAVLETGPVPHVVATGSRAYPTGDQAHRAGQCVLAAYVTELEPD